MSNTFTLDGIRESAQKKYAPVTVALDEENSVVLRGLIRLSKTDRDLVLEHMESLDLIEESAGLDELSEDDRAFLTHALEGIVRLLADKNGHKLVAAARGELTVLFELFETWAKASRLGEANSSPN